MPVGLQVVLADNSDPQTVAIEGAWATGDTGGGFTGFDYLTSAAGTGQTASPGR